MVLLSLATYLYWRFHLKPEIESKAELRAKKLHPPLTVNPDLKVAGVRAFTRQDLAEATDGFSDKRQIGQGGYGKVYMGTLEDGKQVAIKVADPASCQGAHEFYIEIEFLSRIHHRNLVMLEGYCDEENHEMLVYEFMPGGTLRDHLFARSHREPLDFPSRLRIALGAARGIRYLHTEANPPILHRDIKASNILLDKWKGAKVADFGLSCLAPVPDLNGVTPAHVSTVVKGTPGYLDPEYYMTQKLSDKSDVYSFGVVLLELISGRKALQDMGDFTLITDWAWALVKTGQWEAVLDSRMGNRGAAEDMERFVMLALLCAHPLVACRPNMTVALRILENDQKLPSIPDRPIPLTAHRDEMERLSRRHVRPGSSGNSSITPVSRVFSETGFRSFSTSASEGSSRLDGR